MILYLKAGGELRLKLKPDVDEYTRRLETEAGKSLREILTAIGIDPGLVAYGVKDGELKRLNYVPSDGETITLRPPVSGG
jgi:molybdopterin converting factor small subunit